MFSKPQLNRSLTLAQLGQKIKRIEKLERSAEASEAKTLEDLRLKLTDEYNIRAKEEGKENLPRDNNPERDRER